MAITAPQQHFVFVTYPAQGHINPSLNLAKQLSATTGVRVTFCTSIFAHRRMFPTLSSPDEEVEDGLITYSPFSDGYDDGFTDLALYDDFMKQLKLQGSRNLSKIITSLADRGRPVTCVVYTLFVPWVADVAKELNILSIASWVQPATVFAIYYHYFHGYESLIRAHASEPSFTVELPGVPPLQIQDLPSFCTISEDDEFYSIYTAFKEAHLGLDEQEPVVAGQKKVKVLVNSFEALEADVIAAFEKMEIVPVGPSLPPAFLHGLETTGNSEADLIKVDEKRYMDWLNSKQDGSVIYVSFGSYAVLKQNQLEEISRALADSGRPYLWVLRSNNRFEGLQLVESEQGLIVEWCSQVKVLSHKAVGCFVTHCGWNSMLESISCGTPTVCAPLWTDQITNARLAESFWGTGVKAEANDGGVVEAAELRRCLDVVMGDDERGKEIRRKARMWSDKAIAAVKEGGNSYQNLKRFVEDIALNG